MPRSILALDQGTTSSRAIVFDHSGRPIAAAQQEFPQILPAPGDSRARSRGDLDVAARGGPARRSRRAELTAADLAAIGVTNQRETTILWDATRAARWPTPLSGKAASRRPSAIASRPMGWPLFREKTGSGRGRLFLRHEDQASARHDRRRCGPAPKQAKSSSARSIRFLIWRLTGGRQHVTDVSNASRTLLFNIHTLEWDDELLKLLDVPRAMLPEVRSSSEVYGGTDARISARASPIAGCAGDQQAATFGQACFEVGRRKTPTAPAASCS